ncbi:MAG: penicillin-binding transpeptidase domain-containing protein [Christensenellales bacterium]
MKYNFKSRFFAYGAVTAALFIVLLVQMIQLMIVKGEEYASKVTALTERRITISGARGSILDRNGLPLAYDQKAFNVQFYRDPTKNTETDRALYTEIIINAIEIIENNGGKTVDTFVIQYDETKDEYYFDFGITNEENKAKREKKWRADMYVGDKRSPEEIYLFLRNRYQIPAEMSYTQVRKVLSIWQDVQLNTWLAYKPVDIAYDVSIQTVAEISTFAAELTGMSVEDSTVRIYPRANVAAHTIGYLGRITEKGWGTDKEPGIYQQRGYSVDDLIGVEGIEQSMEEYLTGNNSERQGVKVVEVDKNSVVHNILSATEPKQGHNVMLTIDIPLQLALEESLARNIPEINKEQINLYESKKSKEYKNIKDISELRLAESGAAVVLDVHTGDVLAMGSYPSYDLNLFVGGINSKDYELLKNDPSAPLFNKAVSSRATPGSIFKMVTGMGGLMENVITLETRIDDKSPFDKYVRYGKAPRCWQKNTSKHANQTIVEGLQNSCNYFFFTVADGLGMSTLEKWGKEFGLASSTGIELSSEAIGQIGSQQILFDSEKEIDKQATSIPILVQRRIKEIIKKIEESRDVEYDEDVIQKTSEELVYLAGIEWKPDESDRGILKDKDGLSMGDHVRSVLADNLRISEKISRANGWDRDITDYIDELRWTPIMTITSGMGQGYIQITPIAVARYVAALVNGGTVYETHVVGKVVNHDGSVVMEKQPVVFNKIDAPKEYFDAIKLGMQKVVSGEDGTATKYFDGFKYRNEIGGKTGTAQVSTIDLENNSWFVCFAPYEEPEIVVVVYVPHGYAGGMSIAVARDIVGYYLDRKLVVAEQTIPQAGTLAQ